MTGEIAVVELKVVKREGEETTDLHEKDGVVWVSYKVLDRIPWLINAFSTRLGGVSEGIYEQMNLAHTVGDDPEKVLENHRIIGNAIGVDTKDMVLAFQTHTVNVMEVGDRHRGMGIVRERDYCDVDGIMTNVPGICLLTSYADCVPLYFVDPKNRAIALSHSGWRGTAGNICRNTVEKMRKLYGTNPEELIACIGPSIEAKCYEIGEDVAAQFRKTYSEEALERILLPEEGRGDKYLLDLTQANFENMVGSGILPEHITRPDLCTACNASWLHSHRASKGKRGGMCAFLSIRE